MQATHQTFNMARFRGRCTFWVPILIPLTYIIYVIVLKSMYGQVTYESGTQHGETRSFSHETRQKPRVRNVDRDPRVRDVDLDPDEPDLPDIADPIPDQSQNMKFAPFKVDPKLIEDVKQTTDRDADITKQIDKTNAKTNVKDAPEIKNKEKWENEKYWLDAYVPEGLDIDTRKIFGRDGFYQILEESYFNKGKNYTYLKYDWGRNDLMMPQQPDNHDSGTLFPDPNDKYDDRIFKQLAYSPAEKPTTFKKIFVESAKNDLPQSALGYGQKTFLDMKCKVDKCLLIEGVENVFDADLVVLTNRPGYNAATLKMLATRPRKPEQLWGMFSMENPDHNTGTRMHKDREYNWTLTFSPSSTVPSPYVKMYPIKRGVYKSTSAKNYAQAKPRDGAKAMMLTSHCNTSNKRMQYVEELQKYIGVDIYGRCGQTICHKYNKYKFYLAFENANCETYVSEKFFYNGLRSDVIPIVMGAHPAYYKRIAPPHSYIHVEDFESPKEMAEYLHKLDQDDALYNEYFRWKGAWRFLARGEFWCRMCGMLHAEVKTDDVMDLAKWNDDERCIGAKKWTR